MNHYLFIGLFILFIILFIVYKCYYVQENFLFGGSKTTTDPLNDSQKKAIEKIIKEHIQKGFSGMPIIPGKTGPKGDKGVNGTQGPSGGMYVGKGKLVSAQYPEKVIDRMYGMGKSSKGYLGSWTFSPNQMWTMMSETGIIKNHYDMKQCLKFNGPTVFMGNCKNGQSNQWRYHENDMTIRPSSNQQKCLSIGNDVNPDKFSYAIGKNKQREKLKEDNKLMILRLDPCTKSPQYNQKWMFQS
tara:strand:+ start:1068 stop:1793 length:726 start_codon:yes stop_codon:yes gene_type:complete